MWILRASFVFTCLTICQCGSKYDYGDRNIGSGISIPGDIHPSFNPQIMIDRAIHPVDPVEVAPLQKIVDRHNKKYERIKKKKKGERNYHKYRSEIEKILFPDKTYHSTSRPELKRNRNIISSKRRRGESRNRGQKSKNRLRKGKGLPKSRLRKSQRNMMPAGFQINAGIRPDDNYLQTEAANLDRMSNPREDFLADADMKILIEERSEE